jgi:hypothetical protein
MLQFGYRDPLKSALGMKGSRVKTTTFGETTISRLIIEETGHIEGILFGA